MNSNKKNGMVFERQHKVEKSGIVKPLAASASIFRREKTQHEMVESAFHEASKRTGAFKSKYAK